MHPLARALGVRAHALAARGARRAKRFLRQAFGQWSNRVAELPRRNAAVERPVVAEDLDGATCDERRTAEYRHAQLPRLRRRAMPPRTESIRRPAPCHLLHDFEDAPLRRVFAAEDITHAWRTALQRGHVASGDVVYVGIRPASVLPMTPGSFRARWSPINRPRRLPSVTAPGSVHDARIHADKRAALGYVAIGQAIGGHFCTLVVVRFERDGSVGGRERQKRRRVDHAPDPCRIGRGDDMLQATDVHVVEIGASPSPDADERGRVRIASQPPAARVSEAGRARRRRTTSPADHSPLPAARTRPLVPPFGERADDARPRKPVPPVTRTFIEALLLPPILQKIVDRSFDRPLGRPSRARSWILVGSPRSSGDIVRPVARRILLDRDRYLRTRNQHVRAAPRSRSHGPSRRCKGVRVRRVRRSGRYARTVSRTSLRSRFAFRLPTDISGAHRPRSMSAIRRANPDAANIGSCLGPMWLKALAISTCTSPCV